MAEFLKYDVAIIGGGLAGLSAAIQLKRKGFSVVLIEKEQYPFHRVCGEYISMESHAHLTSLGIDTKGLPFINELVLTSSDGNYFRTPLPLGGFGISRHYLDHQLYKIAQSEGVVFHTQAKVEKVFFQEDFAIEVSRTGETFTLTASVCIGSFGKRSNLDIKWKRSFLDQQDKRLENFIGVKYHVKTDWPVNQIGLHNFKNGYCGISKIEDDKYCICYLSNASNLKHSSSIDKMEMEVLFKNPFLEKIFASSEFLPGFPVTISQVNFNRKTQVEDHVLMAGDAGGMITPLCGNGMSIAMHSSKILSRLINDFLHQRITRLTMESQYQEEWKRNFGPRLWKGRMLQRFFGSDMLSNSFVGFFKTFPAMARPVIRQTHGKGF